MIAVAVGALTLLGAGLRVATMDQTLFADELSTYWILDGNSLGEALGSIRSDDEITPPLYFVLAWLTMKLGPDPEWVRLPSLVAGVATIPMVYLLGLRTIGRAAGLVGAAVITLSPFMIFYSVEARSYALMIALLTGGTLALLAAIRSGRTRWWVAYAACSCGAMYSHYTAAFPLAAQFAWVVWAHRDMLRPLVLANLGALAVFAPWIPGFIADTNSPTTAILSALSPFTLEYVRISLEAWAIGYPALQLGVVPGNLATVLLATGVLLAIVALATRALLWLRNSRLGLFAALRGAKPGVVLIVLLAIAAPVGEAIYSAVGSDLLGARNLNASWPGLAVAVGAIVTSAGALSIVCTAMVLSGFAIGAVKTLGYDAARIDYKGVAREIERRWEPGDVVVDSAPLTPVPQTPLDVYLPQTHPEFRLGLPVSDDPFTIFDPVPSPRRLTERALEAGQGMSIFLVAALPGAKLVEAAPRAAEAEGEGQLLGDMFLRRARPEFRVTYEKEFRNIAPIAVYRLEARRSPAEG